MDQKQIKKSSKKRDNKVTKTRSLFERAPSWLGKSSSYNNLHQRISKRPHCYNHKKKSNGSVRNLKLEVLPNKKTADGSIKKISTSTSSTSSTSASSSSLSSFIEHQTSTKDSNSEFTLSKSDSLEETEEKNEQIEEEQQQEEEEEEEEEEEDYWPYRSFDGSYNNIKHPHWGQTGSQLLRRVPAQYGDKISAMAIRIPNNPNPRLVSNELCREQSSDKNKRKVSDIFWVFLQFIDHTADRTAAGKTEPVPIVSPADDPVLPNAMIPFQRSEFDHNTGRKQVDVESIDDIPREQINAISSFIDAGNVYGFDIQRAYALRKLDGSGKLKYSLAENGEILLPLNEQELENDILPNTNPKDYFVAGDVRANENVLLTAMHTLFLRHHNRMCDELLNIHPEWKNNDELLFQEARKIVIATMQSILYYECLPILLGKNAIGEYQGYCSYYNPGIITEFSTVAYRLGHTMLSPHLKLSGDDNANVLPLRDAFFSPKFVQTNGIDNLLVGSCTQLMQNIDSQIVEDVRSFLFSPPNPQKHVMMDLGAINIQRARDHGIADYNTCRKSFNLKKVKSFQEISSNQKVQKLLKQVYGEVNGIDPWIGGLCEDHVEGALVGPLFWNILQWQFSRLRDADRFWFENDPSIDEALLDYIRNTKLSNLIKENTDLQNVPSDVFHVAANS